MPRVKRGTISRKRHKNLLAKTKGFRHGRKNLVKLAHQASVRAMHNAYRDRKAKKRVFRGLWIVRLNAALRPLGVTYSQFIAKLNRSEYNLNRKVLSELAVADPDKFNVIVKKISSSDTKN